MAFSLSPALRDIVLRHAHIDLAEMPPADVQALAPTIIDCLRREGVELATNKQAIEKSAVRLAKHVQATRQTIPNRQSERLESWELGRQPPPPPGNSVFDGLGIVQAMEVK